MSRPIAHVKCLYKTCETQMLAFKLVNIFVRLMQPYLVSVYRKMSLKILILNISKFFESENPTIIYLRNYTDLCMCSGNANITVSEIKIHYTTTCVIVDDAASIITTVITFRLTYVIVDQNLVMSFITRQMQPNLSNSESITLR